MEALEWYATHLCEARPAQSGEALVQSGARTGSQWVGRAGAAEDSVAAAVAG
jgi:hypothetical protein